MSGILVNLENIRPGCKAARDVVGPTGRTVLSEGTELTESEISRLKQLGIVEVYINEEDFDAHASSEKKTQSFDEPCVPVSRAGEPLSKERGERFEKAIDESLHLLQSVSHSPEEILEQEQHSLLAIPTQMLEMIVEDTDQILVTESKDNEIAKSIANNCTQLSILSMALAVELKLPKHEVDTIGMSGLLHDLGLFTMDPKLSDPRITLTEEETEIYEFHPFKSEQLLRELYGVPEDVFVLILQVHERNDGRGFPRGLKEHHLHRLAPILQLSNMYLTLTQARPGRPPIVPHDAIAFLLHQCRKGLFEAELLRAFLNLQSLYAIGAEVELDDGQQATVIRRDDARYDLPTVETADSEVLRLAKSERRVRAPMMRQDQMRISHEMLGDLDYFDLC